MIGGSRKSRYLAHCSTFKAESGRQERILISIRLWNIGKLACPNTERKKEDRAPLLTLLHLSSSSCGQSDVRRFDRLPSAKEGGGESTNGRRKEGTIDGLTDRLDERTNEPTFAEEAKMDLTPLSLTGSSENPSDTS